MRKVIACVLIFLIVAGLVSCSTENQQVHKYSKLKLNNAEITRDLKGSYSNSLLSTDLCIVDKTFPNTVDDAVTSDGALLINITKKECVFSKNLYTRMYPASITKFLTALIALKKCNITDEVTINGEATKIYESGAKMCGFKEGDKISMENLLKSMLVYSGNDAALAIAIHISGSQQEFANEMNRTCKALGASGSNFVNPHGLHDDNQYTTPYDLYLILNELIKYESIFNMYGLPSVDVPYTDAAGNPQTKTFGATNRYTNGKAQAPPNVTVLGGKTGTTDRAGNCLLVHARNTVSNNDYIAVVLNAKSGNDLYTNMTKVLTYAN